MKTKHSDDMQNTQIAGGAEDISEKEQTGEIIPETSDSFGKFKSV